MGERVERREIRVVVVGVWLISSVLSLEALALDLSLILIKLITFTFNNAFVFVMILLGGHFDLAHAFPQMLKESLSFPVCVSPNPA